MSAPQPLAVGMYERDSADSPLQVNLEPTDPASCPSISERRRNAIRNLQTLAQLRTRIEYEIAENVTCARSLNSNYYDYGSASWADIGKCLGVSKQAAQSRYGAK